MSMFKDVPVNVSVIYEGERIRRKDMQVELGGPSIKEKFEIAKVKPLNEVEDGKITMIGPDIKDMKEGGAYPLGILVEVAGSTIDQQLEGVIERRIHGYLNFIESFMHLNQRYDICIRLGKKDFQREKDHPVVARWKAEAVVAEEAAPAEAKEEEGAMIPVATASTLPIMAGGFKIILKDAKIYAKEVIIRSMKSEKS